VVGAAVGAFLGIGAAANGASATSSALSGIFFGSIYFLMFAQGTWDRSKEFRRLNRGSGLSFSERAAIRGACRSGNVPDDDRLRSSITVYARLLAEPLPLQRTAVTVATSWSVVFLGLAVWRLVEGGGRRMIGNVAFAALTVLWGVGLVLARRNRDRAQQLLSRLPQEIA
jgi:hypothetical protein